MSTSVATPETLDALVAGYNDLTKEIAKVIVGQNEIIEQIFISLICRGHVLLVGVPGLAKTLLVHTLSEAIDLAGRDAGRIVSWSELSELC